MDLLLIIPTEYQDQYSEYDVQWEEYGEYELCTEVSVSEEHHQYYMNGCDGVSPQWSVRDVLDEYCAS